MQGDATRLDRSAALIAAVFVLVGVMQIVRTYPVYSNTFDEPAHVAAGMEWLDAGEFTYEPFTPPLARIAVALGPFMSGVRATGSGSVWQEGRSLLYANGEYQKNLTLARLGILPFFLLCTLVTWIWARELAGPLVATASVALLTTLPPILAHAGLATTDMAFTAVLMLALYAFWRWLEHRTWRTTLVVGVTAALALFTKLSALVFYPAGAVGVLVGWWLIRRGESQAGRHRVPLAKALGTIAVVGTIVIWMGYRFSFGPIGDDGFPVPFPELWRGILYMRLKEQIGHEGFLLSEIRLTGWWYFFLVSLALKTPLPFIVLTLAGVAAAAKDQSSKVLLGFPVAAILIVFSTLVSNYNVGVRHVVPIYPLLSIVAGFGVVSLWKAVERPRLAQGLAVVFVVWQMTSTVRAHPDYLPWFNAMAGERPDRILVNSDLDWGQDLLRLADTVEARGIDSLALVYFGTADPFVHIPGVRPLRRFERPAGWFAASISAIKGLEVEGNTGFEWLELVEPDIHIGESIWMYNLDLRYQNQARDSTSGELP